ncbi:MAG TPA: 50S ribosomal protein L33 [Candidatus Saccharimonadales bacterium]
MVDLRSGPFSVKLTETIDISNRHKGLVMAKKGDKRKIVGLVSEESGERIYYTTKNTQNTPEKLSLKKYSPKLRKHVVFLETKKNLGRNEVKPKK